MFTIANRRNRRIAAITTVAAAAFLVTTADFAAPKRDNDNGRRRQVDSGFVKIVHPSTPPSATGDHDITASGLRKRDRKDAPAAFDLRIVYLDRPSGMPNGGSDITTSGMSTGFPKLTPELEPEPVPRFVTITTPSPYARTHHDVTAAGLRKKDRKDASPTPFDLRIVYLDRPSGLPNGGPDITTSGMANHFPKLTPEPEPLPQFVTITTPSPNSGADHDVTAAGLRKRDRKESPTPFDLRIVYLDRPSATPNIGSDITADAMTAAVADPVSKGSSEGRSFLQSLDLTSSVRYIGSSAMTTSSRTPFADGRAWVTLDRESQDGYVAAAGWTFLLK